MKQSYIHITLIALILGLMSSCTERIDIDLDENYQRLVVDGRITRIPGAQYVMLTKTADYFVNQPPSGVSGATVTVDDGENTFDFIEDSVYAGLYKPIDSFVGEIGKTYHLEISLQEAIGEKSFFEALETMPPVSDDIDSVVVERFDNKKEAPWLAGIYAQEPERTDFYMFNAMRNGAMITDSLWRISLTDDRFFNGNYTNGIIVQFLYEDELVDGDTFTLVLSNITEQYYNYLLQAQTEINPKNPLFSGPPANVGTNLSNGAVGYFAAFPSEFTSTIVKDVAEE